MNINEEFYFSKICMGKRFVKNLSFIVLLIIRFQFLLLLIVSTYISRSTRKEAALDGLQLKAPPVHLKQAIL